MIKRNRFLFVNDPYDREESIKYGDKKTKQNYTNFVH